jgi:hypothetical protein
MPAFFKRTTVDSARGFVVIRNVSNTTCKVLTYQQFLNDNRVRIAEILSGLEYR